MTDPEQSLAAFRRLVEALVDFPAELQVNVSEGDGWLRVDVSGAAACDQGKLVGTMGTHARALSFALNAMGSRYGEKWVFKVRFPDSGPRPARGRPPERPKDHDDTKDLATLSDAVEACLGEPLTMGAIPEGEPGDRVFRLVPASRAADTSLREPVDFHNRPSNLVEELGTLFRAIGLRQGVNYRIEVIA